MSTQTLTKEQEAFLEECLLEFSDRYTDADIEYKETYDAGIPPPPITHPWHVRQRLNPHRRFGGNYQQGYNESRYENDSNDSRDGSRRSNNRYGYQDRDRRKFRPY